MIDVPNAAVDAACEVYLRAGGWDRRHIAMRAALAAALPMVAGWRPIPAEVDTSLPPFDGKPIIAGWFAHPKQGGCIPAVWAAGGWRSGWGSKGSPSHWMPLPPPPGAGGAT